jgi:PRC-barrel domain
MTTPVEDVTDLPGKTVMDQKFEPIGEIKEIYAVDGDGYPTWVTVEVHPEEGESKTVFIPLARLKEEDGDLCVPYSVEHICSSPEVDAADELSEADEDALRGYYSIGVGDGELLSDNFSYATRVPDEPGTSKRVRDVEQLETPSADRRTDETQARLEDPGSSEIRKVTAKDVIDEGKMRKGEGDDASGKREEPDEREREDDQQAGSAD